MDILRLLEQLEDMTVHQKGFMGFIRIDKDEIGMQISKIRASLPTELKQAVQTVRESERIVDSARVDATMTLESAQKEAERILLEARRESEKIVEAGKVQQERMVHESEILKLAKAQSEEIRNSADKDAVQMRRGAEDYAYSVLSQLEGVVGKTMQVIERGKSDLERNTANDNRNALTGRSGSG